MSATVLVSSFVLLISNTVSVAGLESENIINGLEAQENQFNYQVSIRRAQQHFCGGALIESDLVLTASHCFLNMKTFEIYDFPFVVVAGSTKIEDVTHRIIIKKIYAPRDFKQDESKTNYNDIAVARLDESFDVSGAVPGIGLVSLPKENKKFYKEKATIAGFGMDKLIVEMNPETGNNKRKGTRSDVLKYETVKIGKCLFEREDETLYCGRIKDATETTPKAICAGDSGGPLVVDTGSRAKVVGIASAAPLDCTNIKIPGYYTKVTKFLSFIDNAKDDIEVDDMMVKNLNTKIYEIPSLDIKIISTSSEIQPIMLYFLINVPNLIRKHQRIDELKKLELKLEKEIERMDKSCDTAYKAKRKELLDIRTTFNVESSELLQFQLEYNNYVRKFSEFKDNQQVYDL